MCSLCHRALPVCHYDLRDRADSCELITHKYKSTQSSFIVLRHLIICDPYVGKGQ